MNTTTTDNILDSVARIRDFLPINYCKVEFCDFVDWPEIKNNKRGVYIILEENKVIYVGKGNIRSRQESHYKKMTGGLTKHDNKEPKGWTYLREQRGVDYTKLQLIVVYLKDKADESAMEGCLIKMLQPYTNDEVFSKNAKLGDL